MLFVNIEKRRRFLINAINALEYQIKIDKTDKDREIHRRTLEIYRDTLKSLENDEREARNYEGNNQEWRSININK